MGGEGWGMSCTGQAADSEPGSLRGARLKNPRRRELGAERVQLERGATLKKTNLGDRNELVWRGQWGFLKRMFVVPLSPE